jgi:pimeloyl-ACP methyl ester carboxylesterase
MRRAVTFFFAMALGCASRPFATTVTRSTTMSDAKTPKMQIDVKGKGPPLVLVGGGLTGWLSWEPHQARLAPTRTVGRAQPLAVQYGLENVPLPSDYSVKMESRALAASVDALFPPGPIDFVAWSYGGFITLDYALDHPERVRTLTLIEPPAFWVLDATGTADSQTERESGDMRALYAQMVGDVTEAQLSTFVRQAGLCPPGKSPEELPQWPLWVKHRRSLRTGSAPWAYKDDAARLRAFDKPVLLVKGTGSSYFLHRIEDGLAKALPRAQTIELPGGHAPNLVAIDAFLDRMATFQR